MASQTADGNVPERPTPTGGDRAETRQVGRFDRLPNRVAPEDMVEEVASDTAKDPDFGRDPDRDWLLRTT